MLSDNGGGPATHSPVDSGFQQDHFRLFGLQPYFQLDRSVLDQTYRSIQARIHPDKHSAGSEEERRVAMQWTARVNEAYQILKDPISRGRYLMQARGRDPLAETETAMPLDFLATHLEAMEALSAARQEKNALALQGLIDGLREAASRLIAALKNLLDDEGDLEQAATVLRKLKFVEKLKFDAQAALEETED